MSAQNCETGKKELFYRLHLALLRVISDRSKICRTMRGAVKSSVRKELVICGIEQCYQGSSENKMERGLTWTTSDKINDGTPGRNRSMTGDRSYSRKRRVLKRAVQRNPVQMRRRYWVITNTDFLHEQHWSDVWAFRQSYRFPYDQMTSVQRQIPFSFGQPRVASSRLLAHTWTFFQIKTNTKIQVSICSYTKRA